MGLGPTQKVSPNTTAVIGLSNAVQTGPSKLLDYVAGETDTGKPIETVVPIGKVLWEGMSRMAAISSTPIDECMVYIMSRQGCDLSQAAGRQLFADSTCSALAGKRWYLKVVVLGVTGYFLVDSGAAVTCVGKKYFDRLDGNLDLLASRVRPISVTGAAMKQYGQTVLSMNVAGKIYHYPPTISDISEDGILGAEFLSYFGCTLSADGELYLEHPYKQRVQCELRRDSQSIACVAQTTRIPPHSSCEVVIGAISVVEASQCLFEPDNTSMRCIGLQGWNALISSAKAALVPMINCTPFEVTLDKGTRIGQLEPVDDCGEASGAEAKAIIAAIASEATTAVELSPGTNLQCATELPVSFETGNAEVTSCRDTPESMGDLPSYLVPLVLEADVTRGEIPSLTGFLERNAKVFAAPGQPLGWTDVVKHHIDTGEATPFRIPYRRFMHSKKDALETEVRKLLEAKTIRDSVSPWSSPVHLVKKKDGTIRFCIDYKKLNGMTRKNAYPLPRIDESLESLGGNSWFCTLDLQSGYHQLAMNESDIQKTAFSTHLGLYEWNVMPFGLCNAPATFEKMMSDMLQGLLWFTCLVYLDDIIVFGRTWIECKNRLQTVFDRLNGYGLKLKPSKCHLFKREIAYLGRLVSADGIKADPSKLRTVAEWPRPSNVTETRSFLGFLSYYRDFIPQFADLAVPLQKLVVTKKTFVFKWGPEQEEAFNLLKAKFINTPVLKYPRSVGRFILDTDASGFAIAGVLSQIQDGKEVPLSFASNTLNKAQRNYCTTKRECLAIFVYFKKWKHFLSGSDYIIRTDHNSLTWLLNFKEAEGMMGRWIATLSELGVDNSKIVYRKGVNHVNADALSRIPVKRCPRVDCEDCGAHNCVVAAINTTPVLLSESDLEWSRSDIKKAQASDPSIKRLFEWVRKGIKPLKEEMSVENVETRRLINQWPHLEIRDGILCRWKTHVREKIRLQIIVPFSLRDDVLEFCHGHRTANHFGRDRTTKSLTTRFYWPGMTKDIEDWLRSCPKCQLVKPGVGIGKIPLTQELAGHRWSRIACDFISGFVKTDRGNVVMMVVQDYYTKYVQVYPLPDHTAPTAAQALVDNWVLLFGAPLRIHSDQGREFESILFQSMLRLLGVRKTRTNPYSPQSDGLVERFNRTLITALACTVDDFQSDWDLQVKFVTHAYNCTIHASTGMSPNSLLFGEDIRLAVDLQFGVVNEPINDPCEVVFVRWLEHCFHHAYTAVRDATGRAAEIQKTGYGPASWRRFKVGEVVVRYHTPLARIKLARNWDGPFVITEVVSNTTVIMRGKDGKFKKSNVRRLKHFVMRPNHRQKPIDWLDIAVGDGPAPPDVNAGTIDIQSQVFTPTMDPRPKGQKPCKRHRPTKSRAKPTTITVGPAPANGLVGSLDRVNKSERGDVKDPPPRRSERLRSKFG